ncbi:MAG: NrsF family protein, partial [Luteibacter jiangsuensis]
MKTDEFVALLAAQTPPVDQHAPARRFALAWVAGFVVALLLMVLLLGVRPDIEDAVRVPTFWFRLCYAGAIAA